MFLLPNTQKVVLLITCQHMYGEHIEPSGVFSHYFSVRSGSIKQTTLFCREGFGGIVDRRSVLHQMVSIGHSFAIGTDI